jgi:hypothetical protein
LNYGLSACWNDSFIAAVGTNKRDAFDADFLLVLDIGISVFE